MEEHKVYLPILKKIRIINYSLYKEDIDYDFIEGLNLIVGGNGVGKTTFINILKYALIGLYKKDLDVKVYKGEKKLTRGRYVNSDLFFRNRTKAIESDQNGYVELYFEINGVLFFVKRSLYETKMIEASYIMDKNEIKIKGDAIKQDLYTDYYDKEKNKNNLQFNYENLVAKEANLSDFDDFIFFVNQILFFGETRENVLWQESAQIRLMNAFFNNPEYEKQRKEFEFDAKYQDSLARHKQEEIKAITRVVDQINKQDVKEGLDIEKLNLIKEIESLEKRQNAISETRNQIERNTQIYYKEASELSSMINDKEKNKEIYESKCNKRLWKDLNPKYAIFKKQYEQNKICPFCNSDLSSKEFNVSDVECFFCHTRLTTPVEQDEVLLKIQTEIKDLISQRTQCEKNISNCEKELDDLDNTFRILKVDLFNKKNLLYSIENNKKDQNTDDLSYKVMMNRIDQLTIEKDEHLKKSEEFTSKSIEITKKIESDLQQNTRAISKVFSDFAEDFMKLPCSLTLELLKGNKTKLFYPVIDKKPRYDAEELSESQRFFVDYSFRMSLLNFFYTTGSFYICETPDSSLDISYEENAANIFIKYISSPNVLILTTNLNNTSFIKTIISKAKNKKILNLLKIGKVSEVQQRHEMLKKLSDELEVMCNA